MKGLKVSSEERSTLKGIVVMQKVAKNRPFVHVLEHTATQNVNQTCLFQLWPSVINADKYLLNNSPR